jgi:hypothetical protein
VFSQGVRQAEVAFSGRTEKKAGQLNRRVEIVVFGIEPICSIVKTAMKRKPAAEPIISPEIWDMAKKSVEAERPAVTKACVVCGASCAPLTGPHPPEEDLCWVCRRLKISAWRDADQQMSAQE